MLAFDLDNLDGSLLMAQQLLKKKEALEKKKRSSIKKSNGKKDLQASSSKRKSATRVCKARPIAEKTDSSTVLAKQSSRKVLKKSSYSKISVADDVSSSSSIRDTATGATATSSSRSDSPTDASIAENFMFRDIMLVDQTWEQIKISVPEYEEILGEQVVLKMMELDPQARQDMKIVSLRSKRFDEIRRALLVMIDLIIMIVGPDVDEFEQELKDIGRTCKEEGISVSLLGEAVSHAVWLTLLTANLEIGEEVIKAWKIVLEFCAQKMVAKESQE